MRESPKRFFFVFCYILSLVLTMVALGGWWGYRDMAGGLDSPSPLADGSTSGP